MQYIIIESKGYNTQMYEYKGYRIWRTHSSEPFRIKKDNKIYKFRIFDNPKQFNKISLKMTCNLIDNGELMDWYRFSVNAR